MQLRSFVIVSLLFLGGCSGNKEQGNTPNTETHGKTVLVPPFNSDSAYYFVQKQVAFGPRIPNSQAHKNTAAYLVDQFTNYGASVTVQEFPATSYDGKKLNLKNIIASFNPDKAKRILLAAHWDTRPFSDKDENKPNAPFDGANDGGSGVGVLLEVARNISLNPPNVGIDIILFDGEDWGERVDEKTSTPKPKGLLEWWCLGSQHWSKNKHKPNYSAFYGILLDMVGGKGSRFAREGYSMEYAPSVVDKVWKAAASLGYSDYFINQKQGGIIDDHVFVNEFAKIPMIDIISYDVATGDFGDFHHTQKDNMDIISKETLKVVGHTLLHVLYNE
jgi:glutaminyl-peptide cyclotransferase